MANESKSPRFAERGASEPRGSEASTTEPIAAINEKAGAAMQATTIDMTTDGVLDVELSFAEATAVIAAVRHALTYESVLSEQLSHALVALTVAVRRFDEDSKPVTYRRRASDSLLYLLGSRSA